MYLISARWQRTSEVHVAVVGLHYMLYCCDLSQVRANVISCCILQKLDKKEIRAFREEIKRNIRRNKRVIALELRKCARNFLRYCDANSDRILTLDEMIVCTNISEFQYIFLEWAANLIRVLSFSRQFVTFQTFHCVPILYICCMTDGIWGGGRS